MVAGHRNDRTYRPADSQCPLCPSRNGQRTEIPADDYEVAVFENRFPAFSLAAETTAAETADPSAEQHFASSDRW